jgi:hypothetical protein
VTVSFTEKLAKDGNHYIFYSLHGQTKRFHSVNMLYQCLCYSNGKRYSCPCALLIKHLTMKAYGGMDV